MEEKGVLMSNGVNNNQYGMPNQPSVDQEISDAPNVEDILDFVMREAPGMAKRGVNTLADYLLKPAGFKSSHQLISEGQESTPGQSAHSNTVLDDFSFFLKGLMDKEGTWFNPEGSSYDTSVPTQFATRILPLPLEDALASDVSVPKDPMLNYLWLKGIYNPPTEGEQSLWDYIQSVDTSYNSNIK